MEHYKISKLLNDSTSSKFVRKKLIEVNDLSSGQYSASKNIRFKTSMLRSDLCDYSYAYIVVKEGISVRGTNDTNKVNKKLIFRNNASFRSCISNIYNTFIDNAEDLEIVMLMYNLLEYSDNYSMTSGSLWNCYRDEVNDDANENNDDSKKINNNKTTTSKSFEYKTKIFGKTTNNNNNTLNGEVVVPIKYLSNIWRFLDLPLINCDIELDLKCTKTCVVSEISRTFRVVDSNASVAVYQVETATAGAAFQINNAKLYAPLVTLSMNDNIK